MEVALLESYFHFFYANSIMKSMFDVFKTKCFGCVSECLSQKNHTCLLLSRKEQLELYFEEVLQQVDENEILMKWEEAVTTMENSALVNMYKLKINCRDWRETDMKSTEWKSKMIRLTLQLLRLHHRFI